MFPEYSLNRQAHCLAHELGHYYIYSSRTKEVHAFFCWIRNNTNFDLILFPFVIFDEYLAWNKAKKICVEEKIDIRFFNYSKAIGINSYWSDYKRLIFNFIKTIFNFYILSVFMVSFFYLANAADINLIFMDKIQEILNTEGFNNNDAVNFLFNFLLCSWFMKWILKLIFSQYKDVQYVIHISKK